MKTINSQLLDRYTEIMHAYSTRVDGVSKYGNNLAYHVNDIKENVDKNHRLLASYLHYPLNKLVHMNQVHKDSILIVNASHNYKEIPTCDALVTNKKHVPLMVMVADCIPVLIYDPVREVVAAVHAGRAGIFKEIIPKTINKMKETYDSESKDIIVSLGPSIHQCCYEVGEDVKEEARQHGYGYAIKTAHGKYYLDLTAIGYEQLIKSGIEKKNIEKSSYCTACQTDTFYSYRAEDKNCGRFSGIIMLK